MADVRTIQTAPVAANFTARDGSPLIWDATGKKAYMLDASSNVVQISAAGVSATIATAKLTGLGANGSMTFTNGLLTASTPAT